MLRVAHKRRWMIRGLSASAKALGVSRVHLWMVLTQRRESASLLRRYQELIDKKNMKTKSKGARL